MIPFKVYYSDIKEKWKNVTFDSKYVGTSLKKEGNIIIDSGKKFQKHMGFGGAFTDATVENFNKLNEQDKERFINAYFSKDGLNYNLGRYPIQSTDFSSYSYNYLGQGVKDLTSIDLSVDDRKIDLVKRCNNAACKLNLMMSVWSPLEWMKDNKSLYHGGHLLYDFYQPWAKYLATVVDGLINKGINITAITSQNEPEASQTWESCIYTPKEEGRFINYLYDELCKTKRDTIHIYAIDHNRDILLKRMEGILSVCHAPIYGIAYHWYDHSCFEELSKAKKLYPNYHLLMSECCVELLVDQNPIGSISHAEKYAYEIIQDLNNYSEGYIDWNLLLNEQGGPNHVGNYCESPIMLDKGSFKMLPTYYYIGHFSKFIKPNSYRIGVTNNSKLDVTAYMTPAGKIVIVILNKNDFNIMETMITGEYSSLLINMKPHSIITMESI